MSSVTTAHAQTVDFDKRLKELGIELPAASPPAANYVKAVRVGNMLYLSGHAAVAGFRGKLGKDITTEQGYQAARSAVGMGALPFNFAVEIELVVEVE